MFILSFMMLSMTSTIKSSLHGVSVNLGRLIKAISHLCDDSQGGNKNELHVF